MRRIGFSAAAVMAVLLSSCGDSLDNQHWRLEKFIGLNKIGSSKDVWLIKHNLAGMNEKVALVFGFVNDYQFCSEIAELYMKRYTADRYSCSFAN